jgi:hypothetical protein
VYYLNISKFSNFTQRSYTQLEHNLFSVPWFLSIIVNTCFILASQKMQNWHEYNGSELSLSVGYLGS